MPLTQIRIESRQPWTKPALARLHMAPLDVSRQIPTGESITELIDVRIFFQPSTQSAWQEVTWEFLNVPGQQPPSPDPELPDPFLDPETGYIHIWLREARSFEQTERSYVAQIRWRTSDGQVMVYPRALTVDHRAR